LAGNRTVLLGNSAAGPVAPTGCDNDGGGLRHASLLVAPDLACSGAGRYVFSLEQGADDVFCTAALAPDRFLARI
jgi:hypothetical protein